MLFAPVILLAQRPAMASQEIPRDWVSAQAQESRIHLGENGRFTLRREQSGGTAENFAGTYRVRSVPAGMAVGGFVGAKRIRLDFDLDSLRKIGVSTEEIEALAAQGETHGEGMQLTYVPSVPVLTDVQTLHFVPTAGRAAATKRLARWMTQD